MKANISVIIPAFNAEGCIARAIKSVQAQTLQATEIIVIDDGSTDNTGTVVAGISEIHSNIKYFRLPQNMGPSAARNYGIKKSNGKWLAFLDADDQFKSKRLQLLHDRASLSGLDLVADNIDVYDIGAGKCLSSVIKCRAFRRRSTQLTLELFLQNDFVETGYPIGLIKPFIRRQFLLDANVFYDEEFRHGEDSHFYASVLASGAKAEFIDVAGYVYTATIGPFSKIVSPFSRTQTNYLKKAKSCDVFLVKFQSQISRKANYLVKKRRQRMIDYSHFRRILDAKKSKLYKKAFLEVMKYPLALRFVLPIIIRRIFGSRV